MKKIDIVAPVECPQLSPERQLLWDAANYMERHGKVAGWAGTVGGPACAIGALYYANYPDVADNDTKNAATELLKKRVGHSVPIWSDSHDRATVVAALRQAALS